jgi:hypothetical protein
MGIAMNIVQHLGKYGMILMWVNAYRIGHINENQYYSRIAVDSGLGARSAGGLVTKRKIK